MILAKIWIILILITVSIYDIRKMVIPDACVLLMLPAALLAGSAWKTRLISAAAVWVIFVLTAFICALFKNEVPVGMGDIKLLSAIGLISGPSGLAASVMLSSLAGGACAAFLLAARKAQKKDRIAFGPFIACAYVLYLASTSAM